MGGKLWSADDDAQLARLLEHNVGIAAAARILGRSRTATRLRAMRLRRRPPSSTHGSSVPLGSSGPLRPVPPSQSGPVAVVGFQEQVLTKSLSTRQAKPAVAYSMSLPKAPSGPVEGSLELQVNLYTNQLEVVRIVEGVEPRRRLRPRDIFYAFGGAWEKITGQRPPS